MGGIQQHYRNVVIAGQGRGGQQRGGIKPEWASIF